MALLPLSISFFVCLILVILSRQLSNTRNDLTAVQASHTQPTSRLGGVAVALGLMGAMAKTNGDQSTILFPLAFCALPVFAAGLLEDSGYRVAPIWRLASSFCSAALVISIFTAVISRTGFAPADQILAFKIPAFLLTALILSGVSQAFNLIDGLHGLCGFASLITSAALATIAQQTEQIAHAEVLWIVMGIVIGFLLLNFPRGFLFLGDAGAYMLGFLLSSIAVDLLQKQENLSPWALILIFFWPLADMILAVMRRIKKRTSSFRADRMHIHHVVMRALEILIFGKKNRTISNPVATLIILPCMAIPAFLGVVFWNKNGIAFALVLGASLSFSVTYHTLIIASKRRSLTKHSKDAPLAAALHPTNRTGA